MYIIYVVIDCPLCINLNSLYKPDVLFMYCIYRIIYNFVCYFIWVWNLVVDIAGRKEAEGVWEYGIEENIWT